MKKNYFFTLLLTLCFSVLSFGQTTVFQESFETGNLGTASESCNDGSGDFFTRTNGSDITSSYSVSGQDGGFFFAAMDTDGSPCTSALQTLFFDDINISSKTDLTLALLLAEDQPSDGKFDWDGGDLFYIEVDYDNSGTFTKVLQFATSATTGFNVSAPLQDTDLDGIGDGDALSDVFSEFTVSLGTGNLVDIRLVFDGLNNGDEDIAVDNIRIVDGYVASPSLSINSPTSNQEFESTVTEIPIAFSISNFLLSGEVGETEVSDGSGDGYIFGTLLRDGVLDGTANIFTITEAIDNPEPGVTYTITAELVDNNGDSLSPKVESTVTFSVKLSCDLVLDEMTATCDALTTGSDTYTGAITFTGGTGIVYTITAPAGVTVGGDDPSNSTFGTITFSGITEGTNADITIVGDAKSSCDFSRTFNSPTCVPAPTCPAIGALIVTEVMQNPGSVGDSDGEYFEVYNTTDSPIDMLGWKIKSLTVASKDHIIASNLVVPANGYAVLGINSDSATNGGVTVNYQYESNFYLGNSSDSIALECSSSIIDSVSWDDGSTFPDPNGKSMELATNKYSATDNDNGANWGEATSVIVTDGDLGTPGTVNGFVLSLAYNSIEGFATYPNPVTNNRFTITSSNSDKKEVIIFNVLGKKVFSSNFTGLKKELNVSTINSGIYILKVTEDGKTATKKLVIR